MKPDRTAPTTIDEYIADYPPHVQQILETVRATIRKAAPEAEEKISYQIPTFFLHGNLVHFGAFTKHMGFYPGSTGIAKFTAELAPYKQAKGSVQFPLEEPLPLGLISRIVKFRVRENRARAEAKKKKKK